MRLGTRIGLLVRNKEKRSTDYLDNASHDDATYDAKYGVRVIAGGECSLACEKIGLVAAGAMARKILRMYNGIEVLAYISKV